MTNPTTSSNVVVLPLRRRPLVVRVPRELEPVAPLIRQFFQALGGRNETRSAHAGWQNPVE
jgi:hypothetical protein